MPDRKRTGFSSCSERAIVIVRLQLKLAMVATRRLRKFKFVWIVVSRLRLMQLNALSMSLARNDGLVAGALYVDLARSHSWAVVRLVIGASIEDR